MKPTPDWQAVRISHLDLTLAWMVCRTASTGSGGPISLIASNYGAPASIVQKALDRVEASMGGRPFFITGRKRTAKLSEHGERFLQNADALIEAWNATLAADALT